MRQLWISDYLPPPKHPQVLLLLFVILLLMMDDVHLLVYLVTFLDQFLKVFILICSH